MARRATELTPVTTSAPPLYCLTCAFTGSNTRRTFWKAGFIASGAEPIFASSIQKAHSASGTWISAFGKTPAPLLRRRPLIWSPWKWLITTASTCSGVKPAARKFAIQRPEVGAPESPLPVSRRVSFLPSFTTRVVKGMKTVSVGWAASARTFCTALVSALRMKPSIGRRKKPSLIAVTCRSPTL